MKDYEQFSDYEQGRLDICTQLSKKHFAQKEHRKSYLVTGYSVYSEGEIPVSIHVVLKDEQVETIKAYLIDQYNKKKNEEHISKWEEFKQAEADDFIDSVFWDHVNADVHSPWYDYVVTVADQAEMVATSFEPEDTENLYQFSCYVYEEDGKISDPHEFLFNLSDEEYIFMLSHLLFQPQGFTYNTLYKYDIDFLDRLNNFVNSLFCDIRVIDIITYPFLVIFNEIVDDAKLLEDEKNHRMIDYIMNDIMEADDK